MSEQVTARGVVHGRVQGVGFRAFTRDQARLHDVTGFAINQSDGSVAFALTGPRSAVEAVVSVLKTGPALARVSSVDVHWLPEEDMQGFKTG